MLKEAIFNLTAVAKLGEGPLELCTRVHGPIKQILFKRTRNHMDAVINKELCPCKSKESQHYSTDGIFV